MEMKVVRGDARLTRIALSGILDLEGESKIGNEFRHLADSSKTHFLVDMSQVSYLASLGIRLLFTTAKSLATSGKKMIVLSPQPMVEETLMTSGTARLIPIAHDEDEALRLL
ncbi:MAG: STAS domain-containing protein [Desulfomonile sp.]|jgi:anti-anti-sigma factor